MRLGPASCFAVALALGCSLERDGLRATGVGGAAGAGTGGVSASGGIGTDSSFGGRAGFGGAFGGSAGDAAPDASSGGTPSGGSAGAAGGVSGGAAGTDGAAGTGGGGADAGPNCGLYPSAQELMIGGSRHCYFRVDPAAKWVVARADCEGKGGYLATIHSGAENDVVRSLAGTASLWIGGTDEKGPSDTSCSEPSYHWITNEAVSFKSWATGNPNCSCNACSGYCDCEHRLVIDAIGVWRDHYEGVGHSWVCEVGQFQ